ncbi:MAG: hypothetical protein KZQ99_22520 [Candidatus Thiodiazotropha sp. (ex Dulcina madagascariensis)]|nr:hypothetical protein [Candidatus Thiodiazotropha sp. (ex Dulcina madagascariensis)]
MRNKVPLFRTIDKRLNIGLLISLACVISVEFVFDKTAELFSGGAKLGEMLSNLSLAFMASYIFYVVVVHMKYVKDKEHLDPYIALKSRQLVTAIRVLTHSLILKAGVDPENKYPSELELKKIASKTHLSDPAPEADRKIHPHINTMSDYFYHWKNISEERLEDIIGLSQYLESNHISLLLKIQESSFYGTLDIIKGINLNNDFSALSSSLYSLSQSAKNLEEYCDSNFSNTVNFSEKHG